MRRLAVKLAGALALGAVMASIGGYAFLRRSLPADRAGQLTELLASRAGGRSFAFLSEVDAASLVACLAEERPQTIAVVLSQMNPARAADVLERLPPDERKGVIRRIASLDGTGEEWVRLIEQVLARMAKTMIRNRVVSVRIAGPQGDRDSNRKARADKGPPRRPKAKIVAPKKGHQPARARKDAKRR